MAHARRSKRTLRIELDIAKPEELDLYERLRVLKKSRQYLPTVREALTLLFSLQDGRIDVLQAMFPDLIEVLKREGADELMDRQSHDLAGKLIDLQAAIERINANGDGPKPLSGGPKTMSVPQFSLPVFDEEEEETVQIRRDTNTDAGKNFLRSMAALNNLNIDLDEDEAQT